MRNAAWGLHIFFCLFVLGKDFKCVAQAILKLTL